MDPISIVAGVSTIVANAYTISKQVYDIIDGIGNAPFHIAAISREIQGLYLVLASLQGLIQSLQHDNLSPAILSVLENLQQPLNHCFFAIHELQHRISKYTRPTKGSTGISKLGKWTAFRWQFTEREANTWRGHLTSYKLTLDVAIATANLASTSSNLFMSRSIEQQIQDMRIQMEMTRSNEEIDTSILADNGSQITDRFFALNRFLETTETILSGSPLSSRSPSPEVHATVYETSMPVSPVETRDINVPEIPRKPISSDAAKERAPVGRASPPRSRSPNTLHLPYRRRKRDLGRFPGIDEIQETTYPPARDTPPVVEPYSEEVNINHPETRVHAAPKPTNDDEPRASRRPTRHTFLEDTSQAPIFVVDPPGIARQFIQVSPDVAQPLDIEPSNSPGVEIASKPEGDDDHAGTFQGFPQHVHQTSDKLADGRARNGRQHTRHRSLFGTVRPRAYGSSTPERVVPEPDSVGSSVPVAVYPDASPNGGDTELPDTFVLPKQEDLGIKNHSRKNPVKRRRQIDEDVPRATGVGRACHDNITSDHPQFDLESLQATPDPDPVPDTGNVDSANREVLTKPNNIINREPRATRKRSSARDTANSPLHRADKSYISPKSSINNPKLLETVQDAIERLILPELEALKREQSSRNRINENSRTRHKSDFDRTATKESGLSDNPTEWRRRLEKEEARSGSPEKSNPRSRKYQSDRNSSKALTEAVMAKLRAANNNEPGTVESRGETASIKKVALSLPEDETPEPNYHKEEVTDTPGESKGIHGATEKVPSARPDESQTSLLIEYFEGSKGSGAIPTRPSVRVRVTPKNKGSGDKVIIEEKGRKPSHTRHISLGSHQSTLPRTLAE